MLNLLKFSLMLLVLLIVKNADSLQIGVNIHPNNYPGSVSDIINVLKSKNINSIRTDYSWGHLEKKKGVFVPENDKLNQLIDIASKENIKIILILDYGNSIYNIDRPIGKSEIDKYVNYAAWVSQHFRGKIYAYEIWNEWSHKDNLKEKSVLMTSANEYGELVKRTSLVIKKNDSKVRIIAGGYNPTSTDDRFWSDEIVDNGVLSFIDGVSVHPYDYSSVTKVDKKKTLKILSNQQMKWKEKTGISTKFYITEFGYSNYMGKYHYSEQQVKDTLLNYVREAKRYPFIEGVWYYELMDDSDDKSKLEANYGLLDYLAKPKKQADSFLETRE